MDGTLLDSTACVTASYSAAVVAGGGEPVEPAVVVAAYPLGPPRVILSHLLRRPATDHDEEGYLSALTLNAAALLVYDGIVELLTALAAREVPVAVFTGASTKAAEHLLEVARLRQFATTVLGSDGDIRPKPAPDGIIRACRRLGVTARNAAYVGDSPLDLEAAKKAKSLSVAAAWGHLFDPDAASDVVATSPADVLAVLEG